jgi:hypothetical protein
MKKDREVSIFSSRRRISDRFLEQKTDGVGRDAQLFTGKASHQPSRFKKHIRFALQPHRRAGNAAKMRKSFP